MDSAIFIGHLMAFAVYIAMIAGIVYIGYRLIQKLIEYRVDYEQDRKAAKDTETEIYKTAAEIEHQLHKDAMEDKP